MFEKIIHGIAIVIALCICMVTSLLIAITLCCSVVIHAGQWLWRHIRPTVVILMLCLCGCMETYTDSEAEALCRQCYDMGKKCMLTCANWGDCHDIMCGEKSRLDRCDRPKWWRD